MCLWRIGVEPTLRRSRRLLKMTADHTSPTTFVPFRIVVKDAFRQLQERYESRSHLPALPTGFASLDDKILGLWPGDLTVIAALPGAGASTLALNMLANIALDEHKLVAFFSIDLRADEIALRLVANRGRIELDVLRSGQLSDGDWRRLSAVMPSLADACIVIDDSRHLRFGDLRQRVVELSQISKPELILVDRLQLLRWDGAETDEGALEGANARALKALARDVDVPVIVLSRFDSVPDWSTVQAGGDIRAHLRSPVAHAADTLIYLSRETHRTRQEGELATAWLILARHRRGEGAKLRLDFDGPQCRFSEPEF